MSTLTDKKIIELCDLADGVSLDDDKATVTVCFSGKQVKPVKRWLDMLDRKQRAEEKAFHAKIQRRIKTDPEFARLWDEVGEIIESARQRNERELANRQRETKPQ